MATFVPAKRATQFIFYGGVVSQANTKVLQSSPTIAAGDFKVSIDGGALANLGTLPVVTPGASKMIKFTLSVAEMTGDNISIIGSDVAGAEWCDFLQSIQTAARQIDDLAFPATSGRSIVVDAAGLVDSNMVKAGPTGAGTAQTAGDIMADTNDIQTRLPAALVGGRMDSSTGAMAANVQTAASTAADYVTELQAGLATSAALATVQADTDNIQTRLPAALSGGRMDSDVNAWRGGAIPVQTGATGIPDTNPIMWAGGTIPLQNIPGVPEVDITHGTGFAINPVVGGDLPAYADVVQPGAISAASFAVAAINASALAADAVVEIQTGLALDATVAKEATLNSKAAAILAAVAAVDTDVWTTVLDAGLTATEIVRLIAAACAGKLSGAATPVNIIRSLGDTKNRITANVDASGNRTGVAYDVTP